MEELTSPFLLLSLAIDIRHGSVSCIHDLESRARETTPPYLPSFPLPPSLSHHSPTQPDGPLTDVESQVQLSPEQHPPRQNFTHRRQAFKTYPQAAAAYRTAFTWSQLGLQYRKRQWQRAYRSRPPALVTQEKRQRQKHAQH